LIVIKMRKIGETNGMTDPVDELNHLWANVLEGGRSQLIQ